MKYLCALIITLVLPIEFNFETDEVTVDYLTPTHITIRYLTSDNETPLTRLRTDFKREIIRSAEDI
jgi:hypothetical protein